MWAFIVWVWLSASQKIPLFWCKTHTKGLHVRFPMRLEEDEGRKVPGKTKKGTEQGSRQKRAGARPVDSDVGLANMRG